jgi:hypothetical protein
MNDTALDRLDRVLLRNRRNLIFDLLVAMSLLAGIALCGIALAAG